MNIVEALRYYSSSVYEIASAYKTSQPSLLVMLEISLSYMAEEVSVNESLVEID